MAVNRRRRSGFALFAVIILIAVFAVLATAVVVAITSVDDADRIRNVADALRRFDSEISGLTPAFKADLSRNPSALTQLTIPITTADRNSCQRVGDTYTATQVSNWKGPYHLTPIPTSGYYLGPGFMANILMERTPAVAQNNNDPGTLSIVIPNVSLEDAKALGTAIEDNPGGTGDTVTFTPSGNSPITVRYKIYITGC